MNESPVLFQYLDHRRYLSDWFDWKKTTHSRFSHRLFARMSKQSSPSLLSQVIKGTRNLTHATTNAYIQALRLDKEEGSYFRLLVDMDAAQTDDERNRLWSKISSSQRFQAARPLEGASFRYLTRWYYVAIRELSTCPGFRPDPTWILSILRPKITLRQASEALQLLTELGMLQPDEDGALRASEPTVTTPHEVAQLAAYNYQRAMLELSQGAMKRFHPTERHVSGLTVAVPLSLVPELKQEVSRFQERILDLCDSAPEPDRVYQLCMQLFPLTAAANPEKT